MAATQSTLAIDNRGDAGGTLGVTPAAEPDADRYTLLITSASHTFAPSLYKKLAYVAVKDESPPFAHRERTRIPVCCTPP